MFTSVALLPPEDSPVAVSAPADTGASGAEQPDRALLRRERCAGAGAHLYREGSLRSVSMLTCCSMRLYSRIGREVKLMLYRVR